MCKKNIYSLYELYGFIQISNYLFFHEPMKIISHNVAIINDDVTDIQRPSVEKTYAIPKFPIAVGPAVIRFNLSIDDFSD